MSDCTIVARDRFTAKLNLPLTSIQQSATMKSGIQPADLGFFSTLAACGSLSAAARELGITTPAVSKRLAQIESRLGVALVNRTTRRMSLTPEGELYLEHARRILGEIDDLAQLLGTARAEPRGLLRVNATLGFGRSHVAPVISRFVRKHPQVEVQLQLSVSPPPLADDAFDVCIRFGARRRGRRPDRQLRRGSGRRRCDPGRRGLHRVERRTGRRPRRGLGRPPGSTEDRR